MPFKVEPNHSQLPSGTHGLYTVSNGAPSALIGTLGCTGLRETWLWKQGLPPFPLEFCLVPFTVDTHPKFSFQAGQIYEFQELDLIDETNRTFISNNFTYRIYPTGKDGDNHIAWMIRDEQVSYIDWILLKQPGDPKRIPIEPGGHLRFKRIDNNESQVANPALGFPFFRRDRLPPVTT